MFPQNATRKRSPNLLDIQGITSYVQSNCNPEYDWRHITCSLTSRSIYQRPRRRRSNSHTNCFTSEINRLSSRLEEPNIQRQILTHGIFVALATALHIRNVKQGLCNVEARERERLVDRGLIVHDLMDVLQSYSATF